MSIEINISNYESYLLSYIDGELNEAEQAALQLFLEKHPQFKQELDLLEGTRLMPDEKIVFENKASLYKTTSADVVDYEELMLGYIDGELTPAEEQTLQVYLAQHPAAQKELLLLQAAKLRPDTSVVFENKASLYRTTQRRISPVYRRIGWGAAAAAVVAGLLIWLLPAGHQPQQTPPVLAHSNSNTVTAPKENVSPAPEVAATPVTTAPEIPAAADTRTSQPALAKNNKTTINHGQKLTPSVVNAAKTPDQVVATATPKTDAPVISQLPQPRNSMDEVVEQHLQQAGNVQVAAAKPEVNKEPILASNAIVANNAGSNKVAPVIEQPGIQGELIMSVSGSDSKILDKVTNVAKFFSRKRNK